VSAVGRTGGRLALPRRQEPAGRRARGRQGGLFPARRLLRGGMPTSRLIARPLPSSGTEALCGTRSATWCRRTSSRSSSSASSSTSIASTRRRSSPSSTASSSPRPASTSWPRRVRSHADRPLPASKPRQALRRLRRLRGPGPGLRLVPLARASSTKPAHKFAPRLAPRAVRRPDGEEPDMTPHVRDYQAEARAAVLRELIDRGRRSTAVVMPTGTGKDRPLRRPGRPAGPYGRVLVLAHRRLLLDQAAEKIIAATGPGVRPPGDGRGPRRGARYRSDDFYRRHLLDPGEAPPKVVAVRGGVPARGRGSGRSTRTTVRPRDRGRMPPLREARTRRTCGPSSTSRRTPAASCWA
jgi:hypothetical protein